MISHGFADAVKSNSTWTDENVLEFAQAIISGFRSYFIEVLGFPGQYPDKPNLGLAGAHDVEKLGEIFEYPSKTYKNEDVCIYLNNHSDNSLDVASYTRLISKNILDIKRSGTKEATIKKLINAEEIALCAAIELYIRSLIAQKKSTTSHFALSGSKSAGMICSVCSSKHGSMPSSVFGRWHVCMTCNRYYCNSCGKKLPSAGVLTRTRHCHCGGNTALID